MADQPQRAGLFAATSAAPQGSLGDDAAFDMTPFDPLPDRYVIRDIDYEVDAGSLQFFFRNPGLALPLPAGGIDEVISLLMRPQFQPSVENFLSLIASSGPQTPLDIELKNKSAYIIFRLPSAGNMYFAPRVAALSHKAAGDFGYTARLMHVGPFGPESDPVDGCKLIYFMARPRLAGDPPATDPYCHSLNIKTRLLQKPHFGTPLPRVLDIVLDPDIRYPGGSITETP